jgi:transcriptional regulator with XRE-family HTH domain
MADKPVPTTLILQNLFKAADVRVFLKRNKEHLNHTPFHEHLSRLCTERNLIPSQVIKEAGIERSYGQQLFNGTRRPSRDKVILLAFGFGMDYDETQGLLKAARKSTLYAKFERDAAIIYALKKRISVGDTQLMLEELELPSLGKEDKLE